MEVWQYIHYRKPYDKNFTARKLFGGRLKSLRDNDKKIQLSKGHSFNLLDIDLLRFDLLVADLLDIDLLEFDLLEFDLLKSDPLEFDLLGFDLLESDLQESY